MRCRIGTFAILSYIFLSTLLGPKCSSGAFIGSSSSSSAPAKDESNEIQGGYRDRQPDLPALYSAPQSHQEQDAQDNEVDQQSSTDRDGTTTEVYFEDREEDTSEDYAFTTGATQSPRSEPEYTVPTNEGGYGGYSNNGRQQNNSGQQQQDSSDNDQQLHRPIDQQQIENHHYPQHSQMPPQQNYHGQFQQQQSAQYGPPPAAQAQYNQPQQVPEQSHNQLNSQQQYNYEQNQVQQQQQYSPSEIQRNNNNGGFQASQYLPPRAQYGQPDNNNNNNGNTYPQPEQARQSYESTNNVEPRYTITKANDISGPSGNYGTPQRESFDSQNDHPAPQNQEQNHFPQNGHQGPELQINDHNAQSLHPEAVYGPPQQQPPQQLQSHNQQQPQIQQQQPSNYQFPQQEFHPSPQQQIHQQPQQQQQQQQPQQQVQQYRHEQRQQVQQFSTVSIQTQSEPQHQGVVQPQQQQQQHQYLPPDNGFTPSQFQSQGQHQQQQSGPRPENIIKNDISSSSDNDLFEFEGFHDNDNVVDAELLSRVQRIIEEHERQQKELQKQLRRESDDAEAYFRDNLHRQENNFNNINSQGDDAQQQNRGGDGGARDFNQNGYNNDNRQRLYSSPSAAGNISETEDGHPGPLQFPSSPFGGQQQRPEEHGRAYGAPGSQIEPEPFRQQQYGSPQSQNAGASPFNQNEQPQQQYQPQSQNQYQQREQKSQTVSGRPQPQIQYQKAILTDHFTESRPELPSRGRNSGAGRAYLPPPSSSPSSEEPQKGNPDNTQNFHSQGEAQPGSNTFNGNAFARDNNEGPQADNKGQSYSAVNDFDKNFQQIVNPSSFYGIPFHHIQNIANAAGQNEVVSQLNNYVNPQFSQSSSSSQFPSQNSIGSNEPQAYSQQGPQILDQAQPSLSALPQVQGIFPTSYNSNGNTRTIIVHEVPYGSIPGVSNRALITPTEFTPSLSLPSGEQAYHNSNNNNNNNNGGDPTQSSPQSSTGENSFYPSPIDNEVNYAHVIQTNNNNPATYPVAQQHSSIQEQSVQQNSVQYGASSQPAPESPYSQDSQHSYTQPTASSYTPSTSNDLSSPKPIYGIPLAPVVDPESLTSSIGDHDSTIVVSSQISFGDQGLAHQDQKSNLNNNVVQFYPITVPQQQPQQQQQQYIQQIVTSPNGYYTQAPADYSSSTGSNSFHNNQLQTAEPIIQSIYPSNPSGGSQGSWIPQEDAAATNPTDINGALPQSYGLSQSDPSVREPSIVYGIFNHTLNSSPSPVYGGSSLPALNSIPVVNSNSVSSPPQSAYYYPRRNRSLKKTTQKFTPTPSSLITSFSVKSEESKV